ncbi:hypothetical protein F4779DRAFT_448063 [Xylariaceae sp. FL0662B]|nr:hypothetical protein F4779DRAFT_448063 [Xylariaceae sp. FL0662B]
MSANNDTPMSRFLLAILKQMKLKDVNWDKVAHDPILAQEITNGHAARMRYSRFRSIILGIEPTRRNRTGPANPSRVTKSKKGSNAKKSKDVKAESTTESPAPPEIPELPAPKIKQETLQYGFDNRLTPGLTPGPTSAPPTMSNTPTVIQPRFLTPCSDTDSFTPSPTLTSSPTSDMINTQNTFDFAGPSCSDHTDPAWQHGPAYTTFANSYPFDDYGLGSCDQHMHHHQQAHFAILNQTIEGDGDDIDVKHEDWDQYR